MLVEPLEMSPLSPLPTSRIGSYINQFFYSNTFALFGQVYQAIRRKLEYRQRIAITLAIILFSGAAAADSYS